MPGAQTFCPGAQQPQGDERLDEGQQPGLRCLVPDSDGQGHGRLASLTYVARGSRSLAQAVRAVRLAGIGSCFRFTTEGAS